MKKSGLKDIIKRFSGTRILVLGDLILDEFIWGTVSRISPEAPVPVVLAASESFMPGGASNVASNIRSLGGEPYLSGVVGRDERGAILRDLLREKRVVIDGIFTDNKRPTILKTRVIAHHQQVVRIDREKSEFLPYDINNKILSYIKGLIAEIDAIIIEDYGKGVVSPSLLKKVLRLARTHKKIVTVDPKEEHFHYYKGVTAITPNHQEASAATGIKIRDKDHIIKTGGKLLNRLKSEGVLITLGENGMMLFERGKRPVHIPTAAQDVFDVSGAGDTVIAVFTLCLSAGAAMVDAARIANAAAGVVVGKVGIASVSPEELLLKIEEI